MSKASRKTIALLSKGNSQIRMKWQRAHHSKGRRHHKYQAWIWIDCTLKRVSMVWISHNLKLMARKMVRARRTQKLTFMDTLKDKMLKASTPRVSKLSRATEAYSTGLVCLSQDQLESKSTMISCKKTQKLPNSSRRSFTSRTFEVGRWWKRVEETTLSQSEHMR